MNDYEGTTLFRPNGTTTSIIVFTDENDVPCGGGHDKDQISPLPSGGHWTFDLTADTGPNVLSFEIAADGMVDPSGSGSFVVSFVPAVPEPSSLAPILPGIASMLGFGWVRRQHIKPTVRRRWQNA